MPRNDMIVLKKKDHKNDFSEIDWIGKKNLEEVRFNYNLEVVQKEMIKVYDLIDCRKWREGSDKSVITRWSKKIKLSQRNSSAKRLEVDLEKWMQPH